MESDNEHARSSILYLKKAVFTLLIVVVVFEVFTFFLSSALGFTVYFFTTAGLDTSRHLISNLPVYIFFLFNVVVPFPVNVGDLFLALWILYLTCLVVASLGPRMRFSKAMRNPSKGIFSNYLFAFTLLANAALFLTFAIQTLQETQGIPTGNPFGSETSNYIVFLLLTYAPAIEELGFRIIPIGMTFLMFFYASRRGTREEDPRWKWKIMVLSFLYPEGVKEELNLKTFRSHGINAITRTEWIAILTTAAIFGVAHYLSGWGIGKITSSFAVGFILALSFIVYGVHAPILIHWFLNFHWEALSLGADTYPSIAPFIDAISYLSLAIGAAFSFYILAQIVLRVVKKVISSKETHLESAGSTNAGQR
jgi:hypothetical protein